MKIETFLNKHFLKRLEEHPALVVYDPVGRYASIVKELATERRTVIDASASTIESREMAMQAWAELGKKQEAGRSLIIFLPTIQPKSDEEKRRDPFWIFALGGGFFPCEDGESWQALCQRAAPGKAERVNRLFAQGEPDFDVVNNLLGEDSVWPKLRNVLGVKSEAEILVALLSPQEEQRKSLEKNGSWIAEFREFARTTLGFPLPKGADDLDALQAETARFLLFSEFVFDLPQTLPDALARVPRASEVSRTLVYQVCDTLRNTETHQERYMEMAERAATELGLEAHFPSAYDFGHRDTFAFEERQFLRLFSQRITEGDFPGATAICKDRERSIWVRHTERQQLWSIAGRLRELLAIADDLETRLSACKDHLPFLIDFYLSEFRRLDTAHREFEQAVADAFGHFPDLESLVETSRKRYLALAEALQKRFLGAVRQEGWPASGRIRHAEVFRRFVVPALDERKKTVLFMVDALRFELAVALEKNLSQHFKVELTPVCAQLPTVTTIGMAALLPDADTDFRVTLQNGELVPMVKGNRVRNPDERLQRAKEWGGDICHMVDLDDLLNKPKSKLRIPDTTRLLIVKSGEIDQICENTPVEAWRFMPKLIRKLMAGIRRVAERGFQRAIMATDHGFFLAETHEQGDVAPKPSGDWKVEKDRCLLGSGSPVAGTLVLSAHDLGIAGDFPNYAVPASLATFSKGIGYFHSGLSLQECLLPVLKVEIGSGAQAAEAAAKIEMKLSYRGGATKKITMRRPMIEVALKQGQQHLMSFGEPVPFQLSAWSGKELVGDVATCNHLDPSTGLLSIQHGESIKIPFVMREDFTGEFEIRAADPVTGVQHARLVLETDYTE